MRLATRTALAFALGACGHEPESADDSTASQRVAAAVDGSSELARLLVPLQAGTDLPPDVAGAKSRQIADTLAAFGALVQNKAQCLQTSSDANSLDVTFTRCRIAFVFTLDGHLHAAIDIEAPAGTPIAVIAEVSSEGMTLTGPARTFTLAGSFSLRHGLPPTGQPVEFAGEVTIGDNSEPALTISATAQWTVVKDPAGGDAPTCVRFTGGAELTGTVLKKLSPIALSGDGITACRNQCPTAGDVELSYGRGNLLTWSYDGSPDVVVQAPRGKTFDVTLPCGSD